MSKVQVSTRNTFQEKHQNHVKDLQVQCNLISVAAAENEDMPWISSMFKLKSETLKFLLNVSIDTLPTPGGNIPPVMNVSCVGTGEQQTNTLGKVTIKSSSGFYY